MIVALTWEWVTLVLGLAALVAGLLAVGLLSEAFRRNADVKETLAQAELERAKRRTILEQPRRE